MNIYKVIRSKDTVNVILMPSKDKSYYSFINLTKGHICPCKFRTVEDAEKDLERYKAKGKVLKYKKIGSVLVESNNN